MAHRLPSGDQRPQRLGGDRRNLDREGSRCTLPAAHVRVSLNAIGVWIRSGDGFRGKIVEITADRATHQFVSRGEISFSLKVDGNAFSGTANAVFHDIDGQQLGARRQTKIEGERVLP